jgi:O-antigen ligase
MKPPTDDRSRRKIRMSPPVWVVVTCAIFGLLVGSFGERLGTAGALVLGALLGLVIALFWMIPSIRRLRRRYETDPLRAKRQT